MHRIHHKDQNYDEDGQFYGDKDENRDDCAFGTDSGDLRMAITELKMIGIDLTLWLDGDRGHNDDDTDDKCEHSDDIDLTLTANCSLNCLINFPSRVRISWVFKR